MLRSRGFPTHTPVLLDVNWVNSAIFGLGEAQADVSAAEDVSMFQLLTGLISVIAEHVELIHSIDIPSHAYKQHRQPLLGDFWYKLIGVISKRHQIDVCPVWLSWRLFDKCDVSEGCESSCLVTPQIDPGMCQQPMAAAAINAASSTVSVTSTAAPHPAP